MDKVKLRASLIKMMLGCLIIAAAVAVITILIGKFSDTTGRALGTIFVALVHIAILFGLVSSLARKKDDPSPKFTDFVLNIAILIVVLSFFTSVLFIWGGISGLLPLKLYTTYLVVLFGFIHAKSIADASTVEAKIAPYALANYALIVLVSALIFGAIYNPSGLDLLEGFYGRALAAAAIVDVTLSVIVIVMNRLFWQKHSNVIENSPGKSHKTAWIILSIVLFLFFGGPFILMWIALSIFHSL